MEALGTYLSKITIYEVVQAAALYLYGPVLVRAGQGYRTGAERVPGLKRQQVFAGLRTPAMGCDVTSVKIKGAWVPLGLTVDDTTGLVLTVDDLDGEDAETLKNWLQPIAERVEADILVTDDEETELERLHSRYRKAILPAKGEKASTAYRLRLLFLDRWNPLVPGPRTRGCGPA